MPRHITIDGEILDGCPADVAKETYIVSCTAVDAETGDGLVVAIKHTFEWLAAGAYWLPALTRVVVCQPISEVNVVLQFEIYTSLIEEVPHLSQLVRVEDTIRITLSSGTCSCELCRSHGHKQE